MQSQVGFRGLLQPNDSVIPIPFLFPSLKRTDSMTSVPSFPPNPPRRRNAKDFLVMNCYTMIQNLLQSQKKRVQKRAMKTWIPQG